MLDFPASPTVGQQFTAAGVVWVWDGAKWAASGLAGSPLVGGVNENRIINGDMRIDQRNNGASGTATAVYTADRWAYGATQAAKGTWQRGGPFLGPIGQSGFPYTLNFTSSSAYASLATDIFSFFQPIEADMVSDFAWGTASAQPVTLSFWVYSSLTGTFGGAVFNYPTPATRSYPFTFNIPVANTWTKITITIPGDTAGTWVMTGNAAAFGVAFDLGSGANFRNPAGAWGNGNYRGVTGAVSVVGTNAAQFNITGVKLEIGSIATPFNRKSLAASLADCQRYYQTGNLTGVGYQLNGGPFQVNTAFNVFMRATPTFTITGNSSGNITSLSLAGTVNSVWNLGTATAAGTVVVATGFTANAEL